MKSVPQLTGEIMTLRDKNRPWQEMDDLIREWGISIRNRAAHIADEWENSGDLARTIIKDIPL